MQRIAIILACIVVWAGSSAQQYPFVHYTPREGLINNRVKFIFQDSKGRLYISTYGGLSVYDGSRFTNYTTNNGLAVNLVNDIVEMGEDSIWILPNDNKIQYLVKGRLKNFLAADNFVPLVNQFIKCSDGYYYAAADEGLFRLENNRFVRVSLEGIAKPGANETLLRLAEVNKKLYILSNPDYKSPTENLIVFDLVKHKIVGFDSSLQVLNLFHLSPNELWVSTGRGLRMLDSASGQFVDPKLLPDSFKDPVPNFLYRDRQQNIWMAGGRGVYKITPSRQVTMFTTENGLPADFQTSILQDRENNMWFTNEQTGVCKLSNPQLAYYPSFKPGFIPTDLFIAPSSDSVWMHDGYHHRLMLVLPSGQISEWTSSGSVPPPLGRLVMTHSGWLVSGTDVYQFSLQGGHYSSHLYFRDTANPIGFSGSARDRYGNLVAVSNKVTVFANGQVLSAPIHYLADQLTIDKNNRVWVAPRSNVLYCFEISYEGDKVKLVLKKSYDNLPPGSPRSITADENGNIWIGTRDRGLYRLHFEGLELVSTRQLTTVNGLSENFVSYLYTDKNNNVWACSPSGLDKIKWENDHFFIENVTRSGNLYLPVSKIEQTARGLFYILTNTGIITYDPNRLPNNWKPSLSFSNIVVDDSSLVSLHSGAELKYDQNSLSFQLSAPSFIDEKQTRFSYLLEGSGNENWSTPSQEASINFVNLPPGDYTLRAKAIFLHGLYPDIESAYSFTILPPWWQTWWFKLIAALLFIGLVILGVRFYIHRKLEVQRVTLEKRRALEKERTRIATDMHDDLGAGLSQIKFLSETIGMRKQKHLPIEEEIDSIRTFSHEMIDKMGEIVWALNEKNDTISDLLSYTRSYAVEYLQQNGIHCRVDEPDNLPQDYVSSEFRRNIYLTVKETLHNIVKHAQASEVLIDIQIGDFLDIVIKDNGKGIDVPATRSSGNGLINMKARIETLKGRFAITNQEGTVVSIHVPLDT